MIADKLERIVVWAFPVVMGIWALFITGVVIMETMTTIIIPAVSALLAGI